MIHRIFPLHFYSLFPAPNKEEIFETLKNIKVNREATDKIRWNSQCKVEVEVLDKKVVENLLRPSLDKFFSMMESSIDINLVVKFLSAWRNTYRKGGFQELHDHVDGEGLEDCHLSGCIFLDDFHLDASQFYFYNRHLSEVPVLWRKLNKLSHSFTLKPKAGDVLFFPSYMLHGVTLHKLMKPRRTISFNIQLGK
jgi:hypothetical protein